MAHTQSRRAFRSIVSLPRALPHFVVGALALAGCRGSETTADSAPAPTDVERPSVVAGRDAAATPATPKDAAATSSDGDVAATSSDGDTAKDGLSSGKDAGTVPPTDAARAGEASADGGGDQPEGDQPQSDAAQGHALGYPGSPPRQPHWGFIDIFQSASGLKGRHEFNFFTNANRPVCTFKAVGPCVQRTCPGGEGTKGTEVDAGRVTVKGSVTTRGISYGPLVMVYGKFERYFNRHHDGVDWVAGEELDLTIEGAEVPPVKATWRYPSRIPAAGITVTPIDRKTGAIFRWGLTDKASVGPTNMRMSIAVPTDIGRFVARFPGSPQTTCWGPLGARQLEVPGEAVAHLAPGMVNVTVENASWSHVKAGPYVLYLVGREEHQPIPATVR